MKAHVTKWDTFLHL